MRRLCVFTGASTNGLSEPSVYRLQVALKVAVLCYITHVRRRRAVCSAAPAPVNRMLVNAG